MAVIVHKNQSRITRTQAMANPTAHRFIPGDGYTLCAPLPKRGAHPPNRANPPDGTRDGSKHMLTVPGGGAQAAFTWLAPHSCWERPGGLRVAFAADYLSRAGWVYAGPVDQLGKN